MINPLNYLSLPLNCSVGNIAPPPKVKDAFRLLGYRNCYKDRKKFCNKNNAVRIDTPLNTSNYEGLPLMACSLGLMIANYRYRTH